MKNKSTDNVCQIATQRPGEARPMTDLEREARREQAEKFREELKRLVTGNSSIEMVAVLKMTDLSYS